MYFLAVIAFTILNQNLGHGEECVRNTVFCPDYTVLNASPDYEERLYPSLSWISTAAIGKQRSDVSKMLIKRLYEYLGGANFRGEQIDMMVPVRTAKVVMDEVNNYTMSIALSSEYQPNPPEPLNELVILVREPPTVYITRSFPGNIKQEEEWDRQSELLKASAANEQMNTSFYYWSVYDSPWTEENRLNEVWFYKSTQEE